MCLIVTWVTWGHSWSRRRTAAIHCVRGSSLGEHAEDWKTEVNGGGDGQSEKVRPTLNQPLRCSLCVREAFWQHIKRRALGETWRGETWTRYGPLGFWCGPPNTGTMSANDRCPSFCFILLVVCQFGERVDTILNCEIPQPLLMERWGSSSSQLLLLFLSSSGGCGLFSLFTEAVGPLFDSGIFHLGVKVCSWEKHFRKHLLLLHLSTLIWSDLIDDDCGPEFSSRRFIGSAFLPHSKKQGAILSSACTQ